MPTLTQSAPASIRASVPSAVATLPAMSWAFGKAALDLAHASQDALGCDRGRCPAPARPPAPRPAPPARSSTSAVTPMAAPHSRRPFSSRAELGYLHGLLNVLDGDQALEVAIRRPQWGASRCVCWRRISCACSRVVPTGAVTRFSLVITSLIGWLKSVSKLQVAVGDDADQLAVLGRSAHRRC